MSHTRNVLFGLGLAFNLIDLQFLGWRTNMETHITRQTNAYLQELAISCRYDEPVTR